MAEHADIQKQWEQLQAMKQREPERAKQKAWELLSALVEPRNHGALPWVFEHGVAPADAPHGDCQGIVMQLYGSVWLTTLDRLVRAGQMLGGIGWAGKSFDTVTRTGYNRLTASSRIPALLTLPNYRFDRIDGELIGFRFDYSIEPSPVAPNGTVLAIRYDHPRHRNPLVLPRTRDELVEIAPQVYLGRALLNEKGAWQVVGYFGLRYPVPARD